MENGVPIVTAAVRSTDYNFFKRGTLFNSEKAVRRQTVIVLGSGVPSGGLGVFKPPPEIPKAHQNRAKLNPFSKIVKNC